MQNVGLCVIDYNRLKGLGIGNCALKAVYNAA